MATVYLIDDNGVYTGVNRERDLKGARRLNEIPLAPPTLEEGEYARWMSGAWHVTKERGEPLDQLRQNKLNEVTALRKQYEQGGINFGGATVGTDKEDQAAINQVLTVLTLAQTDTDYPSTIDFKAGNTFVTINYATASALSKAVANHVQACFTAEKAHYAAINALVEYADIEAYDVTTGWI
jgi:hypothetical protein